MVYKFFQHPSAYNLRNFAPPSNCPDSEKMQSAHSGEPDASLALAEAEAMIATEHISRMVD